MKTNGDNAQISWSNVLKAWVVASKNVALVARTEKDVTGHYPEESRYFIARSIALCWFRQIEGLSASSLAALKEEMHDKTFVGEFVGKKELANFVKYPKESIVFHAVVQNKRIASIAQHNAYCLANGPQILKSHHLDVVPSKTYGPFSEYDEVCDSLLHIYEEVASSTLAGSEEGAVVYFVQKAESKTHPDCVISVAKVKSVQYQSLKLIHSTLATALTDELETKFDALFTKFIKDLRLLQRNGRNLPCTDTFYAELFSVAYSLVAKKSEVDMDMYRGLLQRDRIKFFALVLKSHEEKNAKAKGVGPSIDFESQLLSGNSFQIASVAPQKKPEPQNTEKKAAQLKVEPKVEPKPKSKPQEAAKPSKQPAKQVSGSLKVVIVPPVGLKKSTMKLLQSGYNVAEQYRLNLASVHFGTAQKQNLLIVNSFDGIPAESQTATLTYFLYGLKESTKPDDIAKNFYLVEDYQVAPELNEKLSAAFIRHEVETMQAAAKAAKQVQRLTSEDELMSALGIERPKPAKVEEKPDTKVDAKVDAKPQPTVKAAVKEETKTPKAEVKVEPKKPAAKQEEKPQAAAKDTPRSDSKVEGQNKKIYLFIPIGIPGMGKSFFAANHLEKGLKAADEQGRFTLISQDDIRAKCLAKW